MYPEFNFEVNILNEVRYIQVPPLLFMPVIEYVIQTTVCGENGKGENIRSEFSNGRESASIYLYILSAKKGKSTSSTCF